MRKVKKISSAPYDAVKHGKKIPKRNGELLNSSGSSLRYRFRFSSLKYDPERYYSEKFIFTRKIVRGVGQYPVTSVDLWKKHSFRL